MAILEPSDAIFVPIYGCDTYVPFCFTPCSFHGCLYISRHLRHSSVVYVRLFTNLLMLKLFFYNSWSLILSQSVPFGFKVFLSRRLLWVRDGFCVRALYVLYRVYLPLR